MYWSTEAVQFQRQKKEVGTYHWIRLDDFKTKMRIGEDLRDRLTARIVAGNREIYLETKEIILNYEVRIFF